jgi:DNA-directed RNA polymerase sigma subunit (sigma70/sigma32)
MFDSFPDEKTASLVRSIEARVGRPISKIVQGEVAAQTQRAFAEGFVEGMTVAQAVKRLEETIASSTPIISTRPPRVNDRDWFAYLANIRDHRTLRSIGEEIGVTPERVRQIVMRVEREYRRDRREQGLPSWPPAP